MHYLQKRILDRLRGVESMRYAQLNQDEIESGHFRYHLNELIKDDYVTQLGRGEYALTDLGQSYLDRLSEGKVNPHEMPKVITYTLLTHGNEALLYRKPKQPYKDLLNMIGGKLHIGETASEAAVREVKEKAGMDIEQPAVASVTETLIDKNNAIFSHVIAYVFVVQLQSLSNDASSLERISITELPERNDLAPDFLPIFDTVWIQKQPLQTLQIKL